jgi:NADH-quinone oxidoreductase subunit J
MIEALFYTLSVVSIISALLVVFSKNPVHSVLYLIITFFSIAGQYILLNAQFLFIVQLIVYSGAIMVLFLFVLMLLNLNKESEPQKNTLFKMAGVMIGCLLFISMIALLKGADRIAMPAAYDSQIGLVSNLGKVLFSNYVVPFEISSILFLSGMIGAVMIGKKESTDIN